MMDIIDRSKILSVIALAAFICGCANYDSRQYPLTGRQLASLSEGAVSARDLDLEWNGTGQLTMPRQGNVDSTALPLRIRFAEQDDNTIRHILIDVEVNGMSALALVDTGSPATIATYRLARRSKMRAIQKVDDDNRASAGLHLKPLYGLGGKTSRIAAVAESLRIGGAEFADIPIQIINSRAGLGIMERIGWSRIDMIIGNDLLESFDLLLIDYRNRLLTLDQHTAETLQQPSHPKSIPMIRTRPIPIISGIIADNHPIAIAIDTGSDSGLWIPSKIARKLELLPASNEPEYTYGRGLGGKTVQRNIAPHALTLDNLTIRNVPITIELIPQTDQSPGFALLGQAVLRRFKVEIDYARNRITLERD